MGVRASARARSHALLLDNLEGRTGLAESEVEAGAKTYCIVHPEVADALINEEDFARDERMPYWAELWPSAVALARRLSAEDLSGRRAIELGCGVGLPSLVALDRGALVLATDHYEAALRFAAHNARANLGREPETRLLDWHQPETKKGLAGAFDLVLAADVLYEERNARALTALIPALLASGGEALVADPGRRWEPLFRDLIREEGFGIETREARVEAVGREITIVLHRLRR